MSFHKITLLVLMRVVNYKKGEIMKIYLLKDLSMKNK